MVDNRKDTKRIEYLASGELTYLQRCEIDAAMADTLGLLDGKQPSEKGMHLWRFARRIIRQFNLQRTYSEAHVLNTAYIRAVEAIEAGKCITSPYGWIRSAAYNYVRECDRSQKKIAEFKEEYLPKELVTSENSSYLTPENLHKLEAALQKLTRLEQKIIQLKVVHRKSWKNIQKDLETDGLGTHQISTLRKQKSRALIKLRKNFKAL